MRASPARVRTVRRRTAGATAAIEVRGTPVVITAIASTTAYRATDTADVVRGALSAHFLRRDPYRSGALLEELADERTAQDALEQLVLVAAETLRVIKASPARRHLVLDRDAVVNQFVVARLIRPGQRRLVAELLHRAAGLAAGMRSPGDPSAFDGLSDAQVLVGAWASVLGLVWTAARTLRQDQTTIYLRVLNADG